MIPMPSGACNAHCHVFGPRQRFPYADDAPFVPDVDAPKEALQALNDGFGLSRCVVVQSTCHGLDNRVTEDALASRPGAYRGIALVAVDVSDTELQRLDAAGFRGVRFNYSAHLGSAVPVGDVLELAARLEPLGWHLQIHGHAGILDTVLPALKRSPVPVVIDHIGRIDARDGLDGEAFRQLLGLMGDPRYWVKVSGCDRITALGPPYDDALPFAASLVAEFGDRVLWGNDWPHPNHAERQVDEALLVGLIERMAPTHDARQRLLVDNPQRLYRFE